MRIRDICARTGVSLGLLPTGTHNAITDVPGVKVGHATVIKDGAGPVEAIANALCAAKTTVGIRGRVMHALPLDEVESILRAYGELNARLLTNADRGHAG